MTNFNISSEKISDQAPVPDHDSRLTTHQSPAVTSYQSPVTSHQPDPDEINLLEYIYVLVKNKWWIIGAIVLGLAVGYGLALKKGPRWNSSVLIAAKENDSPKAPNIGGLGALGSLVAQQMNMANNASLEKIDLVLSTRLFNDELAKNCDEKLPIIYKNVWPEEYAVYYDTLNKVWKKGFKKPDTRTISQVLQGYLKKENKKNGLLELSIKSQDSTFSHTILEMNLKYLDQYIRESIEKNSNKNVEYLDSQLITTIDPLIREKLLSLKANEIEKKMLVSSEAFQRIDVIADSKITDHYKKYPLIIAGAFLFLMIFFLLLTYTLSKLYIGKDKDLINKIISEILFLKKSKTRE